MLAHAYTKNVHVSSIETYLGWSAFQCMLGYRCTGRKLFQSTSTQCSRAHPKRR